jgi:lambda family phage tail tape measure protein
MLIGETMANETVNIKLKVSSDGSADQELRTAKQIEATYSNVNKMSGTAGSRAVAAKSAPGMSGAAYGTARGTVGTGASARDFAKEAQGLGGLVRLYATWAANVFAVSAAFSALSNAANVTNMIEGMNQLGINSGIALGSMAKRFVEASQGAISLQDAISATVKATSAGLSQAQFTKLGEVATKASKALGIDMADAVSRLTRGITKLEPELLDELGIFTKVGAATDEYAKRIGKSAASLTDFEKRQAFANAVLAEGANKFGGINVDANPYDQLAASLSNLSTKTLSLVNTALGPLISALSSSPIALATVVAGLGTMLLKQAIPAIGQYKSALAESADAAENKWQQKSDAIKKIEKDQFQYLANMSEAQAETMLAKYEKAESRVKKSRGKGVFDERAQGILEKSDYTSVSKADTEYLKTKQKEAAAAGNTELAKSYKEARLALNAWITSEKEHEKILQKINVQTNANIAAASKFSSAGFARDELAKAKAAKSKANLISQASDDAGIGTMGVAWSNLNKGIKSEGLTGLSKGFTQLSGAAAIAATVFTRAITVVAGFFGWVGLAVGVLTTLYSIFSTNSKEAEALSSAIDLANESGKTATGTFAKFNTELSAQSLMAKSNAMAGLAESVDEVVKKFLEFDRASGTVDNLWEGLKGIVGMSKQDDVATVLSGNIMQMLDNLDNPEAKKKAEDKLKSLLSVKKINFKELGNALESIDPKKLKQLPGIFEETKVKAQATTAAVSQVMEGFKDVTGSFTALENSLKSSDPISNFASAIAKQAATMTAAFKDPEVAAISFQEVLKDTSKLNAFPPEAAAQILAAADSYRNLNASIEDSKNKVKDLDAELAKGAGAFTALFTGKRDELNLKIKADQASIVKLGSVMQTAASSSLDYAFKISLAKLKSASAQGAIDQQKSLISFLPKSENTIKAQMTLENASIDIRKKEIKAVFDLTQEMKITRAQSKVDSLTMQMLLTSPQMDPTGTKMADLDKQRTLAQGELDIYKDKNLGKNIGGIPKELKSLAFSELEVRSGFSAQTKTLDMSKLGNEQKAQVETRIAIFEKQNKQDADFLKDQKVLRDNYMSSDEYLTQTLEQRAKFETDYLKDTQTQRLRAATEAERAKVSTTEAVMAVAPFGSTAARTAAADLPGYKAQLNDAIARFQVEEATNQALAKRGLLSSTTARDYELQASVTEQILVSTTQQYDIAKQGLDQSQALLDVKQSIGAVTQDEYDRQTRLNKLEAIRLDTAQQLTLAVSEYSKKILPGVQETAAGPLSGDRAAQIATDRQAALDYYDKAREKLLGLRDSQVEQVNATYAMSNTMRGFSKIVEDSFANMGDALLEFAKTGKLDFEGLINSMISDLARFALRQSMLNTFNSASGGQGIEGLILAGAKFFGGSAKGNAFDYGIEAFAKGGTFTNSIVNTPTLFKFARGTGLMGEAGPEAIMPLKRDSQGNLGVRAGSGGDVSVVVNNYSTSQAETKETTDSNGNRRIEVIIGDAVAKEVGRPNSPINAGMKANFQLQPNLVRR